MEDPTTIVLNLTFFGTLGVAFIMFLGLFAVFVATLLIAGLGRLVAVIALALAGGVARAARAASAAARPASSAPQLSADWADAVARCGRPRGLAGGAGSRPGRQTLRPRHAQPHGAGPRSATARTRQTAGPGPGPQSRLSPYPG